MAEIFDQIKSYHNQILNAKDNLQSLNEIFTRLTTLQKIKCLKDQEISAIEKAKLLILKSISNLLDGGNHYSLSPKAEPISTFKKALLLGSLFFTSFVAGFCGFITVRNLLGLIITVTNPYLLIASALVGIFESVIFVVADAKEICRAYNVAFFKANTRLRIYKEQLDTTKNIHSLIIRNDLANLDIKPYKACINLINNDLIDKRNYIDRKAAPKLVRRGFKALSQGISGTVAAGSGFFLAQGVLSIFAAALLTNPIGWILCGFTAVFAVTAYCFFRKRNVSKAMDAIMGQPSKFKAELDSFVNEDIEKVNSKLSLIESLNQSKLKNNPGKDIKVDRQVSHKVIFNTYNFSNRFFYSKKHRKHSKSLNSKSVIHRARLA